MSHINPNVRAALLFALWHHQGASSPVGQPIRAMLGIGQYEDLTDEQLAEAKRAAIIEYPAQPEEDGPGYPFAWIDPELRAAGHDRWADAVRHLRISWRFAMQGERWHADRQRELQAQLEKVRASLAAYHQALDNRQHGGVAQDKAMHAIEAAMDMPWIQGASTRGKR